MITTTTTILTMSLALSGFFIITYGSITFSLLSTLPTSKMLLTMLMQFFFISTSIICMRAPLAKLGFMTFFFFKSIDPKTIRGHPSEVLHCNYNGEISQKMDFAKYAHLGAPNMVKWGVPEKILQNVVQTPKERACRRLRLESKKHIFALAYRL